MKTLVLTASIGDRPFNQFTIDSQQKYAAKIGSDFKCITEYEVDPKFNEIEIGRGGNTAYLIKILVINDALEQYDRVIWLDDTCVVSANTPNLFDIVPYELFGAHNEGILDWVMADVQTKELYEENGFPNIITSQGYFNTGVMVVSKIHQQLFSDDIILKMGVQRHFANAYPEQTYLNFLIAKLRLGFFALPSIFNRMVVNVDELEGVRVNYETYTPRQSGFAGMFTQFNFLNAENTRLGQINGAYIYHITSFYKPDKRYKLIERLHQIKVDK